MTDPALIEPSDCSQRSTAEPARIAPAISLESAQALINRVSWIALMLTPMTNERDEHDVVTAVITDLDGLVAALRVAAVDAGDNADHAVEHAGRVLNDARRRLGACWVACIDRGSDPLHADRLADACHLVRGALISLQRGAVP